MNDYFSAIKIYDMILVLASTCLAVWCDCGYILNFQGVRQPICWELKLTMKQNRAWSESLDVEVCWQCSGLYMLKLTERKGLEFGCYSMDCHTIRNYLHMNGAWGLGKAKQHISRCLFAISATARSLSLPHFPFVHKFYDICIFIWFNKSIYIRIAQV